MFFYPCVGWLYCLNMVDTRRCCCSVCDTLLFLPRHLSKQDPINLKLIVDTSACSVSCLKLNLTYLPQVCHGCTQKRRGRPCPPLPSPPPSAVFSDTRRAPSRHCRNARVNSLETTTLHEISTPPTLPSPPPLPLLLHNYVFFSLGVFLRVLVQK